MNISSQLEANIEELKKRFENCQDVIQRQMVATGLPIYVVYVDSMIDRELVEGEFLKNIMYSLEYMPKTDVFEFLQERAVTTADTKEAKTLEDAILAVLSGDTAIFMENCPKALIISSKKFPTRGVQSAESEVAVRGPKDSFTESMRANTVLDSPANPGYPAENITDEGRRSFSDGYYGNVHGRHCPAGTGVRHSGTSEAV